MAVSASVTDGTGVATGQTDYNCKYTNTNTHITIINTQLQENGIKDIITNANTHIHQAMAHIFG